MLSGLCEIAQCSEVFDDVAAIIDDQLRVETEYSQQLFSYHPGQCNDDARREGEWKQVEGEREILE